jgi:CBS domain-containing protein
MDPQATVVWFYPAGKTAGNLVEGRLAMKTVYQLLQVKGNKICSVTPDITVYDALKVMDENNVGALLVLEGGALVGIFSERDYARKVALKGKTSRDTPVREVMTEKVNCVAPSQSVQECMAMMTDKHIRHLPVMENSQLAGVISIGDVVKAIISEQEFTIEQLESYITGSPPMTRGFGA